MSVRSIHETKSTVLLKNRKRKSTLPDAGIFFSRSISLSFADFEVFASIPQVVGDNVRQPGSSKRSPVRQRARHF